METLKKDNTTYAIGADLHVNRMGYGAMRVTGTGVWGPPQDRKAAISLLKEVVAQGVNFIDTAEAYGPHVSEELIAAALHPYPDDLIIATKGGLARSGPNQWYADGSPEFLQKNLEGSLRRLKLEQIPLYQLHRIDPAVPMEESLGYLKKAQEEGKIKHIGLSEVNIAEIEQASKIVDVVSVQNKYSIDSRDWEEELQYTLENNMAFIPWYPLGGGALSSNQVMKDMAAKHGVSIHQLALSWLLHHKPNILLIPGTSSLTHFSENLKAAQVDLSEADMEQLNALKF